LTDRLPDFLSSDQFKAFFMGISDAITVIDRDFRIVWANDRRAAVDRELRVLSGKKERSSAPKYALRDMVGHFCYERFRRRDKPCPQCPSLVAIKTGKPCVVERRIDLPNGLRRWGESRAYPVFGKGGEVDYVIELSMEITDRKRDQEREEKYTRAIERVLGESVGRADSQSCTETPLTPRENDVLRLVSKGLSNREVSRVLGISPHTVKRHVVHIFAKLDVHDRAQAALWAARNGIV